MFTNIVKLSIHNMIMLFLNLQVILTDGLQCVTEGELLNPCGIRDRSQECQVLMELLSAFSNTVCLFSSPPNHQ